MVHLMSLLCFANFIALAVAAHGNEESVAAYTSWLLLIDSSCAAFCSWLPCTVRQVELT